MKGWTRWLDLPQKSWEELNKGEKDRLVYV